MEIMRFKLCSFDDQPVGIRCAMVPVGARILNVAEQDGGIALWWLGDHTKDKEMRHFYIADSPMSINSFVAESPYVGMARTTTKTYHVFDVQEKAVTLSMEKTTRIKRVLQECMEEYKQTPAGKRNYKELIGFSLSDLATDLAPLLAAKMDKLTKGDGE